jgi:DNA-binding GntR family transcriptional regulator
VPLPPVQGHSLVSESTQKLVDAITSGQFKPGERLSEVELARQLGISRSPLREALRALEGKLVTHTPRIGMRVIEFSPPVVEQLYLVREALEGMAARLAAQFATADEIEHLAGLLERHAQRPDVQSGRAYVQGHEDEDFHFAVARAGRCAKLEQVLLSEVYYQLRVHRIQSSTRRGRAKNALEEHKAIVAALHARDPDAAEQAMRRHIRNARGLQTAPPPAEDPAPQALDAPLLR